MALWTVTEIDAEAIAIGAGILGTGGGGNPYLGKLRLQKLLRAGHTVAVIDIEDLPLDALIVEVGTMGARSCPVPTNRAARLRHCKPTSANP